MYVELESETYGCDKRSDAPFKNGSEVCLSLCNDGAINGEFRVEFSWLLSRVGEES